MAVKQRNKRSKPHGNGTNSSAKPAVYDDGMDSAKSDSVHKPKTLFLNPFFIAGLTAIAILLLVIINLVQINRPSKVVIVTNVHEDKEDDIGREEENQEYEYSIDKIDRRAGLSLDEYRKVYDGKWPVLITDVLPEMKAMNWTKKFFLDSYGNDRITIKGVKGKLENAGDTFAMPLHLFMSHLHEGEPELWTYLQDELFLLQRPKLLQDLDGHDILYLQGDYFQLFPKEVRPWNAMLLWGTRYSRSFLHIDPYNWTGTNAVFSGLKKWKLYPPGQDHLLYVKPRAKAGFPLDTYKYNSPIDAFQPDLKRFPNFAKAKAIEFDQHPGELLLIPTGWFHQAYNDDETMAVSSQVMNINNYKIVLEEIFKAGNIDKKSLPSNFHSLSPETQVTTVMKLLPKRILQKGKEVTEDALRQIRGTV